MDQKTWAAAHGMAQPHELDRTEALTHRIMDLVRDTLILKMPYFNRAILALPEHYYIPEDFSGWLDKEGAPTVPKGIGTNGEVLFLNPDAVIAGYRKNPKSIIRAYLHLLLHCIYHHPFHYEALDMELWDLASDIAVEYRILTLDLPETADPSDELRRSALSGLFDRIGSLTAERVYHAFHTDEDLRAEWLPAAGLYHWDIHDFWMTPGRMGNGEASQDGRMLAANPDTEETWKKIGGHVKMQIDAEEENMGMTPNDLTSVILHANRDRQDYTDFLRSFARTEEELHLNTEEFDYIYYLYGMQLYGNMPLIEPLEYREAPKIGDFVIAIDTSGSCQGNMVRAFLDMTYSIMKNSEIFTDPMNLHIIQCDCEIQKDIKITTDAAFESYMKEIEIAGSGGTDFRPVFSHVNALVEKGEFRDLRGLLYLTDGLGMFPDEKPPYRTAFILSTHSNAPVPRTPAWADRYLLIDGRLKKEERNS